MLITLLPKCLLVRYVVVASASSGSLLHFLSAFSVSTAGYPALICFAAVTIHMNMSDAHNRQLTLIDLLFISLRAGCRNARLTARLANRELTVTARLTCGRVARSKVS